MTEIRALAKPPTVNPTAEEKAMADGFAEYLSVIHPEEVLHERVQEVVKQSLPWMSQEPRDAVEYFRRRMAMSCVPHHVAEAVLSLNFCQRFVDEETGVAQWSLLVFFPFHVEKYSQEPSVKVEKTLEAINLNSSDLKKALVSTGGLRQGQEVLHHYNRLFTFDELPYTIEDWTTVNIECFEAYEAHREARWPFQTGPDTITLDSNVSEMLFVVGIVASTEDNIPSCPLYTNAWGHTLGCNDFRERHMQLNNFMSDDINVLMIPPGGMSIIGPSVIHARAHDATLQAAQQLYAEYGRQPETHTMAAGDHEEGGSVTLEVISKEGQSASRTFAIPFGMSSWSALTSAKEVVGDRIKDIREYHHRERPKPACMH